MAQCSDIDPLTTPFVDGEARPVDRMRVAGHIEDCPECHRNVAAEQTARAVVRARADQLIEHAPSALRGRCAAAALRQAAGRNGAGVPRLSRARWPLAMAATLLLAVAGAAAWGLVVHPAEAVAAQLTLDHLKCFTLFGRGSGQSAAQLEAALRRYGFDVPLPGAAALGTGGLALVGGRRCIYLDGQVAHVLYRRGATDVSLFVLPPGAKLSQTELGVLGHTAVAFMRAGRTWVVLARAPREEVERMASVFGEGIESR